MGEYRQKKSLFCRLFVNSLGEITHFPSHTSDSKTGCRSSLLPKKVRVDQTNTSSVITDVFICCRIGSFVPRALSLLALAPSFHSSTAFRQILSAFTGFVSAPLPPKVAMTPRIEPVLVTEATITIGEAELVCVGCCSSSRSGSVAARLVVSVQVVALVSAGSIDFASLASPKKRRRKMQR